MGPGSLSADARSTLIGTVIANYRVLDLVSVGGMGTVYRAEHMLIGRIVAIKVLHAELSTNREIINRFFNEAKATTTIGHPGIVEIFDFGHMDSGHAYIVMEFLDGVTLSRRIKLRGPMAEHEAATYLCGVCSALAAAHDKGIVHRDLKPDNIILVPDLQSPIGERSKLLDFGIAKLTDTGFAGTATKTGAVMGTPTYMSPEQCRGTGDVDQRTDIYAIGCMFYELISGRPPFINPGMGELIGSHLFVQPDPVSKHAAHVSPGTDALIMKLLDKQPENRVQTARQLVGLLTAIAEGGTHHSTYRDSQVRAPDEPTLPQRPLVLPQEPLPTPAGYVYGAAQKPNPTTLSGVASQAVGLPPPPPLRSRRGLAIGIGVGVFAIGVTLGIAFVGTGDKQRAASDVPTAPPPPAETTPDAPKAADTKPDETKPGDTKPDLGLVEETKPDETK
ncbi:MAG: serine/threonine protein kinase, partial [Deltaproteobacteria bacterium]|nr:serine/threonine protein kinase [Deltaproteobacteria bacterium]